MEIINIDFKEAVIQSAHLFEDVLPQQVCLTGGNFGLQLVKGLKKINYNFSSVDFFLTDERLHCSKNDQNLNLLMRELEKLKNFQVNNFHAFQQTENPESSYKELVKKISPSFFDVTILSLGDDGHLAGHFANSHPLEDKRFCYTSDAKKAPNSRISFDLDFLIKSKQVVLAIFGEEKKNAAKDLINGQGIHSSICKSPTLKVFTDINL